MRYVVIALGVITLAVAVPLAMEGQWWVALPDGAFGLGVAFMAYASLRADHPAQPAAAGTRAAAPPPARPAEPVAAPAPEAPPAAAPPEPSARRKRRH